jgi:hypothetical protein
VGGGAGVRWSLLAAAAASAAAAEVPHLETARERVPRPGSGSARAASGEAALAGRSAGTGRSEAGQRAGIGCPCSEPDSKEEVDSDLGLFCCCGGRGGTTGVAGGVLLKWQSTRERAILV